MTTLARSPLNQIFTPKSTYPKGSIGRQLVYSGVFTDLLGGDPTGVADSTAAFTAALAIAKAMGMKYRPGPGTFLVRAAALQPGDCIEGEGENKTILYTDSDTAGVLVASDPTGIRLIGLHLRGTLTATAGALLTLNGSGGVANSFSLIRDCTFENGFNHNDTTSSYAWGIETCYFTGFYQYAILVANTVNADAGDSHITGSVFANARGANAVCIEHESSGGLRIIDNKGNTGLYFYRMQLKGATSDLVLVGNSVENATAAAFGFFWTSGSFNNVVVDDNQISLCPSGILMNDTHQFFDKGSVCGNTISAATQYGVIIDNASNVELDGNSIGGNAGNTGLTLGANFSGVVGDNEITGFTNDVVNNSTTGAVVRKVKLLLARTTGANTPADTTEDVVYTAYMRALGLGTNGAIRITLNWVCTNNANTKTLRVRLGGIAGTVVWSYVHTANDRGHAVIVIGAAGANNAQVTDSITTVDTTVQSIAPVTSAVDMTALQQIVVTAQKQVAGDTITIRNCVIEHLGGT